MAKAKMIYSTDGMRFEWSGGEYIELFFIDPDTDTFPKSAFDVINVWDYAKGEPRIEKTLDAFNEFIKQHIQEIAEDNIANSNEEEEFYLGS